MQISVLSVVKKEPRRKPESSFECRGDLTTEDTKEAWRATDGNSRNHAKASARIRISSVSDSPGANSPAGLLCRPVTAIISTLRSVSST